MRIGRNEVILGSYNVELLLVEQTGCCYLSKLTEKHTDLTLMQALLFMRNMTGKKEKQGQKLSQRKRVRNVHLQRRSQCGILQCLDSRGSQREPCQRVDRQSQICLMDEGIHVSSCDVSKRCGSSYSLSPCG